MKQFAKAMSFITFAITLLCSNNRAFGQVTEKHDYKNDVENNILIYRIRESNLFNELKADVTPEIAPDFLNLLPPSLFKLKLSFAKLDSLQYPLSGYDIYQVRNMDYAYANGEVSKEVYTYDAKPNLRSRYYLIAYNKDEQRTIYICGDFLNPLCLLILI